MIENFAHEFGEKMHKMTVPVKTIWYFFLLLIEKSTTRKKYQYGTFSLCKTNILHLVFFLTGTFSYTPLILTPVIKLRIVIILALVLILSILLVLTAVI